jgi:hypothetical protein
MGLTGVGMAGLTGREASTREVKGSGDFLIAGAVSKVVLISFLSIR